MKKLMLVATMVLGFAGMSFAQLTANASANLKLQIVTAMSMSVNGSVNFGSFATATNGTESVAPASGAVFTVSGTPGASFTVTLPVATSYNLSNGTTTITFTPTLEASVDGTTNSGTPSTGSAYTLGSSGTNSGKYYFLLGGSVTLGGSESAGAYTGTYTLTATYN